MNLEDFLDRKLKSLFSDSSARTTVTGILNSYGIEKHEQEPIRVQLAILKLSGADIEQVRINTKYAKQDFRDVLVWAESPNLGAVWNKPDGPAKQNVIDTDKADYDIWLRE